MYVYMHVYPCVRMYARVCENMLCVLECVFWGVRACHLFNAASTSSTIVLNEGNEPVSAPFAIYLRQEFDYIVFFSVRR